MTAPVATPAAARDLRPAASSHDLDALLAGRLRKGLAGTVLDGRTATVVFEAAGAGIWTVELDNGRGRVRRGRGTDEPTLLVRTSGDVLAGMTAGTENGTEAFLEGRLTVRGDLSLALALDGMFHEEPGRPDDWPRAKRADVMGVRTFYLEAGPADAPPVLLLHGLGATNASMLPVLADLARDFRVLSPDSPGFGASSAPSGPYNPAWFAAWVESFQAATGSRGAVLVGNSLGGRISLEAGLAHPKSVRGMVLLTPSPAFRRLREWVPLVRFLPPQAARLVPMPLTHGMIVEGLRAMMSQADRLPEPWYDAAADEAVRVFRSPAHRVAFFAAARQIYLEDAYGMNGFWDRLPRLLPPALFVWGDRDRLVPSSFARHVAEALPDAGQIVLEDCGHVPQFEHPEETNAMIRGFIDGL